MSPGSTLPAYRGRFAPTPSGPLHAGSLLTALASWLCARRNQGTWLIRIDDLDTARCRPQYATRILSQLEAHGLYWDAAPDYQSRQRDCYHDALTQLEKAGRVYRCTCTRARIRREQRQAIDGPIYSGRCRNLDQSASRHALRLRAPEGTLTLDDRGQGRLTRDISRDVGDCVLQRADGVIAYHLACAVDEPRLGITEVVRGGDLIGPTFCQRLVLDALSQPAPAYHHLPVLLDQSGNKLSKQNHAAPIDDAKATANLYGALCQLGQSPPVELIGARVERLLDWALTHWDVAQIPATPTLRV